MVDRFNRRPFSLSSNFIKSNVSLYEFCSSIKTSSTLFFVVSNIFITAHAVAEQRRKINDENSIYELTKTSGKTKRETFIDLLA